MCRLWHDPPVSHQAVAELLSRAQYDIDTGRLPSCQLALARDGEMIVDVTLGAAAPDARFTVFSVTKAYIAAAVWLLMGDGRLSAETRVADVIPEFGTNGKEGVTLEHLLTHTAGFPRAPMRPEEGATSEGRVARFATWRLDWPPGSQLEYHGTSAHWVVAELIERTSGRDYRTFLADRIAAPLGLRRLRLGVHPDEGADVVELVMVGHTDTDLGLAEAKPDMLLRYNEPDVRAVGVPGAGAVSTAADVAMFYQALLHNPSSLWDPAVLADATSHVRTTYVDALRGVSANRTLGLTVAGDDGNAPMRDFGTTNSARAFGASGIGGQIAWADPETGLSFCWLTNGLTADIVATYKRSVGLSTRAARCVARGEAKER
jgi:CubicO group peptidase (beta-lactamase class C family)